MKSVMLPADFDGEMAWMVKLEREGASGPVDGRGEVPRGGTKGNVVGGNGGGAGVVVEKGNNEDGGSKEISVKGGERGDFGLVERTLMAGPDAIEGNGGYASLMDGNRASVNGEGKMCGDTQRNGERSADGPGGIIGGEGRICICGGGIEAGGHCNEACGYEGCRTMELSVCFWAKLVF